MDVLFIYFAKSIFISLIFGLYYTLFLQGKEFHHYNRFYLLITTVMSLILPLIKVDWFTIQPDNEKIYQLIYLINGKSVEFTSRTEITLGFWHYLAIIFGTISLFFIIKFIISILRIKQIKQKYPNEKHKAYNLIITDLYFAPFTFFKNLFWNKSIDIQSDSGKKIFMHELVHIQQKHSLDRIFLQVIRAIFWFNPIFYFINNEIALIHEYLADQKAVANRDIKVFAEMLLKQYFHKAQILCC